MALSSAAPEVSTSTTAYYRCTVSAVGAQTVTVTRSDGLVLPGASYTIEVPQVSMVISNTGVIQPVLVITLEPVKAPITTTNFLAYVNAGFYSGVVFHRSVRASDAQGFVVLQGGGYNGPLVAGSAAPSVKPPINANIVLEDNTGLLNSVMTLSMARSSAPDTANSQFFINLANNTVLDRSGSADFQRGYAVFGSITAGSSLLTALLGGPCAAWLNFLGSAACLPTPNLTIVSATQSR
jgi:cyclophilin family peptidyl-prolyl cis-trans isomerase